MGVEVVKLAGGVGAEITGLDLDKPVDQATTELLNEAWLQAGVLLFRDVGESPEKQIALSKCFGELEVHPIVDIRVEGYPELIWLSNVDKRTAPIYRYEGKRTVGRIPWHTDMVYTTSPGRGALLRMIKMPERGGETGWIDTAAVYDALPEATKQKIEGLEAKFEFILDPREMLFGRPEQVELESEGDMVFPEFPDVVHPLVWEHPLSGRKALNVSTLHLRSIIDMPEEEGSALLTELVEHALNPEFRYVHDWNPNDMVLWDNWRTMHSAFGHAPELERLVHRTTISANHPFGRLL